MYWLVAIAIASLIMILKWVSHEMDKAITYKCPKSLRGRSSQK